MSVVGFVVVEEEEDDDEEEEEDVAIGGKYFKKRVEWHISVPVVIAEGKGRSGIVMVGC